MKHGNIDLLEEKLSDSDKILLECECYDFFVDKNWKIRGLVFNGEYNNLNNLYQK